MSVRSSSGSSGGTGVDRRGEVDEAHDPPSLVQAMHALGDPRE